MKKAILFLSVGAFVLASCSGNQGDQTDAPSTAQDSVNQVEQIKTVDYDIQNDALFRDSQSDADANFCDYVISCDVWVPAGKNLASEPTWDHSQVDNDLLVAMVNEITDPGRTADGWVYYEVRVENNDANLRQDSADSNNRIGEVNHSNELTEDFTVEITFGTNNTPRRYKLKLADIKPLPVPQPN